MIAYLDSSLVLRYILKGESTIKHAFAFELVVSSELLEIECRRVLHRCRMQGELNDHTFVTAVSRLEKVLAGIALIGLSVEVKKRAMDSFPVVIKTLDALHLATALFCAEKRPEEKIHVFTHDEGMNRCAAVLGFGVPLA